MTDIREYLAHKPLLFDGGMGTYYKAAPGADCEMANLTDPEGVKKVHAEYLAAGAQAIKTNTFGLPRMAAAQTPEAVFMTGLDQRLPGMTVKKKYSITGKNVNSYQNGFELLISDLARWKKEKYQ